ncbi:DUF1638 domain-containing protein [Clostridium scatologenes]|uniref:DUF1638 domain-containing protein n=1 Tax=Clostridium scatologenes TaxID=1548 RepID=A0A0E3JYD7_CLOSL|nr:DUF1638 domain-containing protein [Clostridium scatologenes]AKA67414.1 Protein of unknown function DUF1638 [Clostridium scatologenes]
MNTVIVACRTITDELNMAIKETSCKYPVLWIESGLHTNTESLRKRIQEELDHISNVEQVLLGFGYCGNALIGLKSSNYRMIFPKVDDCVALLLGSCERRKKISEEEGTYFLTKGWLDFENNIWAEYKETVRRHGKDRADRVYEIILKNYKRLGVINTNTFPIEDFLRKTDEIAKDLKLRQEVIPGTLSYIKKLLTGPWNDEFVVMNPNETITLKHVYDNAEIGQHCKCDCDNFNLNSKGREDEVR